MDALDGNAIGGLLLDVFGSEMTTATGVCGSCGASAVVAELTVYMRAPGTVVRCRSCESVLMRVSVIPSDRYSTSGLLPAMCIEIVPSALPHRSASRASALRFQSFACWRS